ncbi:MAG: hypothetical protein PHE78_07445, partial [Candidatus Gastranaerophilales bacterium]|nr:hypothetical protein [Candidatus Gastranaerophilales bacterium]
MKKVILTFLVFLLGAVNAFATELPLNIQTKLKKEISGVTVRFDGLIEYPSGTQYLPVFPMELKKDTQAKVVLTYPSGKTLQEEPALVLFDNNFAMLKILKSQTRNPTVIFYNEMPLCVKRGLLPQDLLVPENLVLPEELEILLGNLSIPLEKIGDDFDYFKDFDRFFDPQKAQQVKKQNPSSAQNTFSKSYPCLGGKMIYAINYQANAIYVINPETGKVLKVIALRSTPSNIIMTRDQRYLLVSMLGTPKLAVIDLDKNAVVKEIDSGQLPISVAVDKIKNLAYIANQNSSSVSIVDLGNMDLVDRIEVSGKPSKLTLSSNRKNLLYLDSDTESVYSIFLDEDLREINFLFKTRNLSDIIEVNNKYYLICR